MAKRNVSVRISRKTKAPIKGTSIHRTMFTIRALRVLSIIGQEASHPTAILDEYGFQHHNIMSLTSVQHIVIMLSRKGFIRKTDKKWKYNELNEKVKDGRIVTYSITKQGQKFLEEVGDAIL